MTEATHTKSPIRSARTEDMAAIVALYNHYIENTPITFDIDPHRVEQRQAWFDGFNETGRHRLLVGELEGAVVGYACSHQFRTKAAYDTTVETSVYLAPEAVGRGLGSALYSELFSRLEGEDLHRAYAGITLPNEASTALHERFGFEELGVFREVGRKFGKYWDVLWLEKAL